MDSDQSTGDLATTASSPEPVTQGRTISPRAGTTRRWRPLPSNGLPAGEWRSEHRVPAAHTGPMLHRSSPVDHGAHRRSAFMIAWKQQSQTTASEGCVIMARGIREAIVASWTQS